MSDHSQPNTNGSGSYASVLANLMGRIDDVCRMFRTGSFSNIPDGTIRFNDTAKRFEKWSSTAGTWGELTDRYAINVDRVGDKYISIYNDANTVSVRDANGKLPGSITGDAASVASRVPGTGAGNLVFLDGTGKIPSTQLNMGVGDADTVDGRHLSWSNVGDTIPLRSNDSTPKILTDTEGTHHGSVAGDLYGATMGGSLGNNGGVILLNTPGYTTWTCPWGVVKVLALLWGGGGGTNGSNGGSTTFGSLVAGGGSAASVSGNGNPGSGNGALGHSGMTNKRAVTNVTVGAGGLPGQVVINQTYTIIRDNYSALGNVHGLGANALTYGGGNGGFAGDYVTVSPGTVYGINIGAAGGSGGAAEAATAGALILLY